MTPTPDSEFASDAAVNTNDATVAEVDGAVEPTDSGTLVDASPDQGQPGEPFAVMGLLIVMMRSATTVI